jgi:hypothetical protein
MSYDLNSAYKQSQSNMGGTDREFRASVKIHRANLKKRSEIYFRVLPAFAPGTVSVGEDGALTFTDPTSWMTFRDAGQGHLNPWARIVNTYDFVGHGGIQDGRRVTIISPEVFDNGGVSDNPVEELRNEARKSAEWKYLTEKIEGPGGEFLEGAAIPYKSTKLLMNILDLGDLEKGVQLAVFKKSAMDALLGEKGIASQRNNHCTEQMAAADPMLNWNCGDLTHPTSGPVLKLHKSDKGGKYATFVIDMVVNETGRGLKTYPVGPELMATRNFLESPDALMPRYSGQEIVDMLVKALDGINPMTRQHEHTLLHRVFSGKYNVPEPPVVAAMPVGVGFGAPGQPAQGGIPGLGAPPAQSAAPSQPTFTPPPQQSPTAGLPGATSAPQNAPAPNTGVAAGTTGIPGMNDNSVPAAQQQQPVTNVPGAPVEGSSTDLSFMGMLGTDKANVGGAKQ